MSNIWPDEDLWALIAGPEQRAARQAIHELGNETYNTLGINPVLRPSNALHVGDTSMVVTARTGSGLALFVDTYVDGYKLADRYGTRVLNDTFVERLLFVLADINRRWREKLEVVSGPQL